MFENSRESFSCMQLQTNCRGLQKQVLGTGGREGGLTFRGFCLRFHRKSVVYIDPFRFHEKTWCSLVVYNLERNAWHCSINYVGHPIFANALPFVSCLLMQYFLLFDLQEEPTIEMNPALTSGVRGKIGMDKFRCPVDRYIVCSLLNRGN